MHGVTKPVTLEVESVSPEINDGYGCLRRGLTAQTHIDRRDFGLSFNIPMDGGGLVVGDSIDISIDVETHAQGRIGPPRDHSAEAVLYQAARVSLRSLNLFDHKMCGDRAASSRQWRNGERGAISRGITNREN